MNLSYSDEQNMLREQVLKFCESDYTFDVREKIVESNYGHNPETWKQFADLGWLAVPFSEENGGFNFGYGATGMYIPNNAQTYYYVCQPHVSMGMVGVIIVKKMY